MTNNAPMTPERVNFERAVKHLVRRELLLLFEVDIKKINGIIDVLCKDINHVGEILNDDAFLRGVMSGYSDGKDDNR